MRKTILIKITEDPEALTHRARNAATKYGLAFTGDAENGLIQGLGIKATYQIRGDRLKLNILRKPLFLSWKMAEQQVRALVNLDSINE